jgi:hypothetical protein
MTTYTIINENGERFNYLTGAFEANLAWHMGHPDNDGFLQEALDLMKQQTGNEALEIVIHHKG